ncbi:potassium channel family protein [Mycoplasma sp. CSL7491-lung]|uniref:potassium channel family protein n=1 Tax=Mycoplasma sp. CSL7491-lung TaxID=549718 RepID=UPI001C1033EC|nr:potassium channel family protein [Mycoplasma sp. CSL7491-lung]MBU4693092.1 potassium channel family protein [Mycoplasma sp. CSL7491-lung]
MKKRNYKMIFEFLTPIVWNFNDDMKNKNNIYKTQSKLFKFVYILLVILASLVSVLSIATTAKIFGQGWKNFITILQIFTFFFFIVDYILHLLTYRTYKKIDNHTMLYESSYKFIFSIKGIVILLSILSSLHIIEYFIEVDSTSQKAFEFFKLLNFFRFARLFWILTIFTPFAIIAAAFKKQKKVLTYVLLLAILLIFIFAIIIWSNETSYLEEQRNNFLLSNKIKPSEDSWKIYLEAQESNNKELYLKEHLYYDQDKIAIYDAIFPNYDQLKSGYVITFLDAIYFATITLTTIGYGDLLPHSPITKIIVSVNALVALAIIAIPSGIIAGSFLNEMQEHLKKQKKEKSKLNNEKEVKND